MRNTFLIAILCLLAFSCSQNNKYRDDFYNNSGQELPYVPLLKPYYSQKWEELGWSVELEHNIDSANRMLYYLQIDSINKVDVVNGVIYIHNTCTAANIPNPGALNWFLIVPDRKLEWGFQSEEEMITYLKKKRMPFPNWKNIDEVWENFSTTGYLPWPHLKGQEIK